MRLNAEMAVTEQWVVGFVVGLNSTLLNSDLLLKDGIVDGMCIVCLKKPKGGVEGVGRRAQMCMIQLTLQSGDDPSRHKNRLHDRLSGCEQTHNSKYMQTLLCTSNIFTWLDENNSNPA